MCRLAAQLGKPLHEVVEWPAWSVQLMQVFLSREPTAEERCEVAVAHASAIYAGANMSRGKPRPKISDFMLFRNAWEQKIDESRYTADELKTMAVLGLKRA